jgi:hypothetical protein
MTYPTKRISGALRTKEFKKLNPHDIYNEGRNKSRIKLCRQKNNKNKPETL